MTSDQKHFMWGEGQIYIDGEEGPEVQEAGIAIGIENISERKGDGGGNIVVATGQPITGRCVLAAITPQLLAELTGGSNATGTVLRKRPTTVTKSTNDVTIADATYILNTLKVIPAGANKAPLKKVAATPAVGEYTISTTTITLNASQTEDDFILDYFYTDAANGLTTTIGATDLPDEFEIYISVRAKDLYPGTKGDVVFKCAKAVRTSEISLIGSVGDAAKPGFDFDVRIDSDGDLEIYWPS